LQVLPCIMALVGVGGSFQAQNTVPWKHTPAYSLPLLHHLLLQTDATHTHYVSPAAAQVPLVLTMPAKKSKGSKLSGCGCMIPAASKVLAKVSPSSRLGSGGSTGSKDSTSKVPSTHAPSPGLEKPSPDRQRLIGQGLNSSDEQGAAADAGLGAAGEGSSGGGLVPLPGMDALHYFGVFDGHGGADAARYCAQHMHQVGMCPWVTHPDSPCRMASGAKPLHPWLCLSSAWLCLSSAWSVMCDVV
jgi:hypothetical protein